MVGVSDERQCDVVNPCRLAMTQLVLWWYQYRRNLNFHCLIYNAFSIFCWHLHCKDDGTDIAGFKKNVFGFSSQPAFVRLDGCGKRDLTDISCIKMNELLSPSCDTIWKLFNHTEVNCVCLEIRIYLTLVMLAYQNWISNLENWKSFDQCLVEAICVLLSFNEYFKTMIMSTWKMWRIAIWLR